MRKKGKEEDVPISDVLRELLQTSILRSIAKRDGEEFARKLAVWLVRYILVVVSLKEALGVSLEEILQDLHGKKYRKVNDITDRIFEKMVNDEGRYRSYIW